VLSAIRTGRHGSYERLTLQFTSSFGEVNVGYVPVVHADASYKVVPLQGSSFLQIVVHGAVAQWSATPITPYTGPSTVTPGYPTLKQVSISGDFEAVLSFGVGLDRTAGFQVTRLQSPDRLVVDIAERPPWQMWPDDNLAMAREVQAGSYQGHMAWRNSGASVAWCYAFDVYGWAKPVVTPVPGTDAYRLTDHGSGIARLCHGPGRAGISRNRQVQHLRNRRHPLNQIAPGESLRSARGRTGPADQVGEVCRTCTC